MKELLLIDVDDVKDSSEVRFFGVDQREVIVFYIQVEGSKGNFIGIYYDLKIWRRGFWVSVMVIRGIGFLIGQK